MYNKNKKNLHRSKKIDTYIHTYIKNTKNQWENYIKHWLEKVETKQKINKNRKQIVLKYTKLFINIDVRFYITLKGKKHIFPITIW